MSVNTLNTMDSMMKEVYAPNWSNLVPNIAILSRLLPFNTKEMIGKAFNMPVVVRPSQGVTYASTKAGAFTINAPIASITQNISIVGSQILANGQVDYEAEAAAMNGNKASFVEATKYVIGEILESAHRRLEIAMLYGGSGLGTNGTTANTNVDTTHTTFHFTTASWAVGIWSTSEGAILNFYNGSTLVSTGTDADFTVTAFDPVAYTITVSGSTTGISALDIASSSALDVYYQDSYGKTMYGIDAILTNTGSMFGIDASVYSLWKSQSYAVGGAALSFAKVQAAVTLAVGRGLTSDVTLLCNPNTWKDLSADQAALRSYDQSYRADKAVVGVNSIQYHSSNGVINVVSHPCIKQGEAFLIPLDKFDRIGSTDVVFKNSPNGTGDQYFLPLSSQAGFELRAYTSQAIFCKAPAHAVKLTGIVNNS